jgi:hypothetical protein
MNSAGETWSPVFDPQTWAELLAAHTAKGDMFSAKTLATILDGVEHLALARLEPGCPLVVTGFHASLFERLQGSFNNPALLKAIGMNWRGSSPRPTAISISWRKRPRWPWPDRAAISRPIRRWTRFRRRSPR